MTTEYIKEIKKQSMTLLELAAIANNELTESFKAGELQPSVKAIVDEIDSKYSDVDVTGKNSIIFKHKNKTLCRIDQPRASRFPYTIINSITARQKDFRLNDNGEINAKELTALKNHIIKLINTNMKIVVAELEKENAKLGVSNKFAEELKKQGLEIEEVTQYSVVVTHKGIDIDISTKTKLATLDIPADKLKRVLEILSK